MFLLPNLAKLLDRHQFLAVGDNFQHLPNAKPKPIAFAPLFLLKSPLLVHTLLHRVNKRKIPFHFFREQLDRACWKSFSWGQGVGCGVWGVGFYRFSGGQLPNFQGKSTWIFPPITPMVGTFWGQKSLKTLSNKVFRFIQQTLTIPITLVLDNARYQKCKIVDELALSLSI